MIGRKIFKRKKKLHNYFLYLFIIIICFIIYYIIFIYSKNNKNFVIKSFNDDYYIIPIDKEGLKIPNTNKKILHLNEKSNKFIDLGNNYNLNYSIQILVSSNYNDISAFIEKQKKYNETIYSIEDFYTLIFTSDLGIDFFLLYKNFQGKNDAKDYCTKYLSQLDKCLIINAKNLK